MSDRRSPGDPLFVRGARFLRREGQRIAVGIVGGVIVIAGIVLMPLPGPGIAVVLAGLAVLATQFSWAQDLLDRVRDRIRKVIERLRGPRNGDGSSSGPRMDSGAVGGRSDAA